MQQFPVLDLDRVSVAELRDACARWGFFAVRGHGIPGEVIDALRAASRAFFLGDRGNKRAVLRSAGNTWGYYDEELTKNVRDWKEIFDVGPSGPSAEAQWPGQPEGFREALEVYSDQAHRLALTLLDRVTEAFGGRSQKRCFDDHTSFLRLNYYPPCDDPAPADADTVPEAGHLGISHHTDAGALTVLDQADVAGLQVLQGGVWFDVPVFDDALVINVGDIVQVWSNDLFAAPVHRVLASAGERFSTAYFLNPSESTVYAPLVEEAAKYRPILWKTFRQARADGDYANQGEEVQISHFAVNQR